MCADMIIDKRKRKIYALLFMGPAILVLVLFLVVPICYGFGISFMDFNLAKPASARTFIGLNNYKAILNNSHFWNSIKFTLGFMIVGVIGTVVLAMLLALALNSSMVKGLIGRFTKSIFILPMMLCPVVVANIWYIIFAPNYGLINSTLSRLDMNTISFLGDTLWARLALIIVEFWWGTPYIMIILLAALTTVPAKLYEAAQLDGAGKVQCFFYITLPSIRNFIILVVAIRLMDTLRMFDISFTLTEGGPQKTTQTISYFIYERGFEYINTGQASAASMFLFLTIAIITFVFMKISIKSTSELTE